MSYKNNEYLLQLFPILCLPSSKSVPKLNTLKYAYNIIMSKA